MNENEIAEVEQAFLVYWGRGPERHPTDYGDQSVIARDAFKAGHTVGLEKAEAARDALRAQLAVHIAWPELAATLGVHQVWRDVKLDGEEWGTVSLTVEDAVGLEFALSGLGRRVAALERALGRVLELEAQKGYDSCQLENDQGGKCGIGWNVEICKPRCVARMVHAALSVAEFKAQIEQVSQSVQDAVRGDPS